MSRSLVSDVMWGNVSDPPLHNHEELMGAVDKYAKNHAMSFSEWCQDNGWEKHIGENMWYNRMGYGTELTTDQLYQLFLDHKSKQP